jgi:hypothetical protein
MATFTKQLLSGSTNGKGIKVVQTATAGTLIHTAVAGTSSLDEIWLYAHNTSASAVKLTLEYGGVAAPDDQIEVNIGVDGTGLILVAPGILLQNGLVVRAFAGTANVINIFGYVNRIA